MRLESRNANSEGEGKISIADLIKAALRMNPDRIIVGEVRGGEALDMLQAMNTGHDGSLSTGHSNSPKDMLSRIETMALSGADLPLPAIRSQIAGALDIIVHLGRLRDRSRRVLEIVEVGAAEYAVVELTGKIPDSIHAGWKYVFEVFFPEQGYRHSGKPDFEVYSEGDMYSETYKMELWVPIVKEL